MLIIDFTRYIKHGIIICMKEIGIIFGVVFLFGIIFVIPNEIKSSSDNEKYNFNYIVKKNNMLNEENLAVNSSDEISFNMDLRKRSKYTAKDYNVMLKGTNLEGLGTSFKKCDDIGVNSLFMIALACHESNYGKSFLSINKNNLFGFKAYDREPYNSAKYFSSKEECIEYVANYIYNNYLSENGIYFNGYTISSINIKYATDKTWANKIYDIMKKLESKV